MPGVVHRIAIDCHRIVDRATFHDVFAAAFGFPDFYGRNMDAWIDCLTCIDDPDAGMTNVFVPAGSVLAIELIGAGDLASRSRDLYDDIVSGSSFVNWRRIEQGEPPVLALSFKD